MSDLPMTPPDLPPPDGVLAHGTAGRAPRDEEEVEGARSARLDREAAATRTDPDLLREGGGAGDDTKAPLTLEEEAGRPALTLLQLL